MTATVTPAGTQPKGSSSGSKKKQRLIVLVAAVVLTVLALASGVFAVMSSGKASGAGSDQAWVDLLEATDATDRALYTELQDELQASQGQRGKPDQKRLNQEVEKFEKAVAAVGKDPKQVAKTLKLGDSEVDQQTRLFLEDPKTRVKGSRDQLTLGTPVGAKLPAEYKTSRQALHNLTTKIAGTFSNQVLTSPAEKLAKNMDAEKAAPPARIDQEPQPGDPRAEALKELKDGIKTIKADAKFGPLTLWIATGVEGALAIALWVFFALNNKAWLAAAAVAKPQVTAVPAKPKASPKPETTPKPEASAKSEVKPEAKSPTAGTATAESPASKPAAEAQKPQARPAFSFGKKKDAEPASTASKDASPAAATAAKPAVAPAKPATAASAKPATVPASKPTATAPTQPGASKPRVPFAPTAPGARPASSSTAAGSQPATGAVPPKPPVKATPPDTAPAKAAGAPDKGSESTEPKKAGPKVPWRTTGDN
ncbi:MAG: hypothetical protein LBO75_05265 [Bifidobacteriaceae bacterium]|jgi:flagellar basal body-associated protein FliL|nr:hypothetical protein [Bifidobacteriaceae bacterium]